MSISSAPSWKTTSSAPALAICRASSRPAPGTKPRSSAPTRAAAVCSTEKPFQSPFLRAEPGREREHRRAVVARERALPDQNQRAFGLGEDLAETMTLGDMRQRVGAGAEIIVVIGQVGAFADQRRPGNRRPASACGCAH